MNAQLQEQQQKPLSDDDLIAAIDDAEQRSYGSGVSSMTAELAAERALNIDLYLGRDVDPAPDGQSGAIDRVVFETVQWVLPALCRIFANGDDVVTLVPVGEQDVAQAKQETAYLNWLVTTKHPWFELFLEWCTDALLTKNAYFLVYRDMKRKVEIEKYYGQTKAGLALLLSDKDCELIDARSYQADDLPPEPVIGPDGQPQMQVVGVDPMGQPIVQPVMEPSVLYDVVIRRTGDQKDLCIRVLPPERVKVDQLTYGWRIDDSCNYFEYFEQTTISALREQGFDVEDDIADNIEIEMQEETARDLYNETRLDYRPTDPSMRRVNARMIWIRTDINGDGKAELLQCLRVGQKILYKEEVSRIPVASGVTCPLPHRHIGLALADQVSDIQIIRTAILRQGLDNLYLSNNPQKVLDESKVNIDDALISRPGGIIRASDIMAYRTEQAPFVFPQAVEGLRFMGEMAQIRTGVSPGMSSIDSSQLANIQPGTVNQLSSMAAERVVQIARILAFAVEDLFSIVHEQTLKIGHKKETIKIEGKWVEVDPGSWKRRDSFKIAVAFSAGNKDAQIARLGALKQAQFEALTTGIPVCTPQNYYETLVELTKATDFTAPDRFWTDPQKMPPKPPPQPPPEIIVHQMDNASKEKIKAAELHQSDIESQRKAEMDKYAIDSQAGLEVIHKQIDHGHTVAIEGLKASHAAILDAMGQKWDSEHSATSRAVSKAHEAISQQNQSIGGIHETLNRALDAVTRAGKLATAKKNIRRAKDGSVEGVDLLDHEGNILQSHVAIKDQSGRVVGMQ